LVRPDRPPTGTGKHASPPRPPQKARKRFLTPFSATFFRLRREARLKYAAPSGRPAVGWLRDQRNGFGTAAFAVSTEHRCLASPRRRRTEGLRVDHAQLSSN
jgi:hypothetical protein